MFFEWTGCEVVGVGLGTCNRTIRATFSVDGSTLFWNESIRAVRTHVPWYRCELVPTLCVGTVRHPSLPRTSTATIFRRLMFGKLHAHVILPVNRTYELDQLPHHYMSSYIFGLGELRPGEWISFRSGQWGAINDPNDELYVPNSQTIHVDGDGSYTATKLPLRLPALGEQPGVLAAGAPSQGYTYDAVTQTSTYTLVGPPACYSSLNEPCIHKAGSYVASRQSPSPPPSPPAPPSWPPGFFTPSPAPPMPASPPDLRLWSQPETWGGVSPKRGDTVEIPEGITIIMDVSPPFLWRLDVKGTLLVWNKPATDVTLQLVFLHVHEHGTFAAGSPGDAFRGKLAIHLAGDTLAEPRNFCSGIGSKSICVEGRLFLHGRAPTRPWTYLNATAHAGDDSLVLQERVDWLAGEKVVVAATGYDQAEAEKMTFGEAMQLGAADEHAPTVLGGLSGQLAHTHYAATEKHASFDVSMRAEVALISRNIEVVAVDMFDHDFFFEPQDPPSFGFRLTVRHGAEANLVGVRFVKGGYFFSERIYWPQLALGASGSVVRSCVFDEAFSQPIRIEAPWVVVQSNVIVSSVMSGIKVAAPGATITGNLVLGAHCMPWCAGCCGKWDVWAGAYEIDGGATDDLVLTNNTAAGGPIGFKFNTAPPATFADNVAHSAQFGIIVNGGCGGRPVRLQHTLIYRAWDFGLWGHTPADCELFEFSHLVFVDSKVSFTWGAAGPDSAQHLIGEQTIYLRDSLIVGQSHGNSGNCDESGSTTAAFSWGKSKAQTAIMMPIFVTAYLVWPGWGDYGEAYSEITYANFMAGSV